MARQPACNWCPRQLHSRQPMQCWPHRTGKQEVQAQDTSICNVASIAWPTCAALHAAQSFRATHRSASCTTNAHEGCAAGSRTAVIANSSSQRTVQDMSSGCRSVRSGSPAARAPSSSAHSECCIQQRLSIHESLCTVGPAGKRSLMATCKDADTCTQTTWPVTSWHT